MALETRIAIVLHQIDRLPNEIIITRCFQACLVSEPVEFPSLSNFFDHQDFLNDFVRDVFNLMLNPCLVKTRQISKLAEFSSLSNFTGDQTFCQWFG